MSQPVPFPTRSPGPFTADDPLVIDCDTCVLQDTDSCADCVVTFLCGVDASEPVVVDLAEARAMRELEVAGLAPPLRHVTRSGPHVRSG
jgi:hypothetical protein